ncbi:MAG: alpha/beta hydrolase [Elusimicrobia bacterium]|nr:alpha/beta hydrolase [Elusimicrobiota bacterium]
MNFPAPARLILALAAVWIGLRWFENAMVFHPSRVVDVLPGAYGLAFERVRLTASDGVALDAWWLPAAHADAPVMLCLHGNGGSLSNRVEKMRIFHAAGAAQLWVEWRGYGASAGTPSEAGLYRDAQAGRDWLATRGVPPSRLVLYGESLGSGPAVELAARAPAAGLIVDSGFASIPAMAAVVLPWFPTGLARIRFDNLAKLPRVTCPTLFLHSPQDDIVPYAQARLNFAAAGGQKTFVDLKGSHNEGFLDSQPIYGDAIRNFLASTKQVK